LDICRESRREVSAPKGQEDSAQGFNPGNRHPDMNVRSMKNTRSSGLEMLKGRQIERTNDAKVGFKLYTSQLGTLVFAQQ
jgi:hypothetical protein